MRRLTIALLLLLVGAAAEAEIYKCENKATGEVEFKDVPCTTEQLAQAVPKSIRKATGDYSVDESRALAAIVRTDRAAFGAVCEEQLDGLALSKEEYRRRCESALEKQADCKIAASRMFPSKVHNAYVREIANGSSEEEASAAAQARENWDDMTPEEATVMFPPIAKFTSVCIRGVFK